MKTAVSVLLTAMLIGAMYFNSPYKESKQIFNVEVTSVEISDVNNNVNIRGKARSKTTSLVFPQTASVVSKVLVLPGQKVLAGEDIILYDDGTTAKAKIAGTLLEIYCSEGEISAPIIPCAQIADLTRMEICAEIGENKLNKIKIGNTAEISFDAYPANSAHGTVENIAAYAKTSYFSLQKQEVKTDVIVSLDDLGFEIGPGYSADVRIKTEIKRNASLIPFDCIAQDAQNREYIMVAGKNSLAQKVYIQTGLELDNQAEILTELDKDALIIRNPENILHGSKIEISVAP